MTVDTKEMLNKILDVVSGIDYVKPEDIPDIDLYMDQVTTFMENHLASTKRHEDDKILTKTMINNYAKNRLLPPPEKKRYSREHLLIMIFIYYFKNILSINDIQKLFGPITEKYFKSDTDRDMNYIYSEVLDMEKSHIEYLKKELVRGYHVAENTFPDADPEDQEFLEIFSYICLLSFDVYAKKMLIERILDGMTPDMKDPSSSKEKGKKAKEKT